MRAFRANLDLLFVSSSLVVTVASLQAGIELRSLLGIGRLPVPDYVQVPPALLGGLGLIWFTVLMLLRVPAVVRDGRLIDALFRVTSAVGLAVFTFAGMLYLTYRELPRLTFVYFAALDLLGVLLLAFSVRWMLHRQTTEAPVQQVLVVGTNADARRIAAALERSRTHRARVIGFLADGAADVGDWPVLGRLDDAHRVVQHHRITEVVIVLPLDQHPRLVDLVRQLQATPVHIRMMPSLVDFAVLTASVEYVEGLPLFGLRVPALSDEVRLWKRLFDVVISTFLMVVLALPMLLIAMLIRLDSPGPVIYRTRRVGENGRHFWMYKFRSMVVDAEDRWNEVIQRDPDGRLRFKSPTDPRVTRMGAWLRRTSLDELPQLWNVLAGEMSLVGPRPELPAIVEHEYEPWQWSRFTVPQGITGWWQVNRRGHEHQHLCTADDLYYIQNHSLLLDVQILLRTVLVVLQREGAY